MGGWEDGKMGGCGQQVDEWMSGLLDKGKGKGAIGHL